MSAMAFHAAGAPLVSRVDFHALAVGPDGPVPPTRMIPSPATAADAAPRASGSARTSDGVHVEMTPVAVSGVPAKTVAVGAPEASKPPMT